MMPVIFVAHGAPLLAIEPKRAAPIAAWGKALPRPKAILVISAHWETEGFFLGRTSSHEQLVYDFGSRLPRALFEMQYCAPGAPDLADRLAPLLDAKQSDRGLDHGAWIPLAVMFPAADVPILQLSLPRNMTPAQLIGVGRTLQPLREEGVLVCGSGNVVHNLMTLDVTETRPVADWAVSFDEWIKHTLASADHEWLARWQHVAPSPPLAHPTDEHLRPLFVCAGAGVGLPITWALEGFEHGNTSRRCVQFG